MTKYLFTLLTVILTSFSWAQTLIMNEVSQGVTGNMEYVEFVVVDNTVTYDCNATTPPSIDIRGWIFDDNSGYHGAVGVASGAIRFSFDPLWSAVPLGTIILIYNDAAPDPSIPVSDLSLNDGNCMISAPISNPSLFESNATTPGAIACSYPAAGWTPGGNWSNTLLANGGDCARIVDLNGCEVFSVCYGTANLNTLIYFLDGADPSATDHRNTVYYFNDGDPVLQANWSIGCTDDELVLDANQCGANFQTPGVPNNPANAAYIAQFNNGCVPITPVALSAVTDNNESCVCDGQATATGSGSIGPYSYEWFDALMNPIGQTSATATGLCDGTYYVEVTSAIGCQETAMITIAPGSNLPTATISGGGVFCTGSAVTPVEIAVTGVSGWTVNYSIDGIPQTPVSGVSTPIVLGSGAGTYQLTGITDANCSNSASGAATITLLPLPAVTGVYNGGAYCMGDPVNSVSVDVTGSPAFSLSYTLNGVAQPPATGAGPTLFLGNAPGSYVVTGISDANCSNNASGTQTITINTAPVVNSVTGGGSYCAGDPVNPVIVDATGSGALTVSWTLNGVPQTPVSSASSPISLGNAAGVYVVTGVADANCSAVSNLSQSITVNPNPVISAQPTDPSACNLTDGSILVQGNGTGILDWSGSASGAVSATLNYSITGLASGSYALTFTDGTTGCVSNVLSVSLNNPNAPVLNPVADQQVCDSYDLPAITGTGLSGNQAYYNDSQLNGGTVITGPITSSQTIWIYDLQGSCSDEESFTVTVTNSPMIDDPGPQSACDVLNLPAITGTNLSPSVDYYTNPPSLGGVPISGPLTTSQTVWLYDANGACADSLSISVSVIPTPGAPVLSPDATYCYDGELEPMTASGTGGTFLWYADPSFIVFAGIGPSVLPIETWGTTTYYVIETVPGCTGPFSTVTITFVECNLTVPTAFTPDGDGVNDDWELVDLDEVYPGNVVTIYNRWGNVLYQHDSNADGPYDQNRWDGTYNGDPLPVGSYYFIIDLGALAEGEESITGTVSIIKGN